VDPDLLNLKPDICVLRSLAPDPDPGGYFFYQKCKKLTIEISIFLWNVFLSGFCVGLPSFRRSLKFSGKNIKA
jgi:hypothetical protein